MHKSMSIAAIQMNSILGEPTLNLDRVEALLATLEGDVDIVCLPELFNVGYNLDALGNRLRELAEPVPDGTTTRRLAEMARRFHVSILAGLVEADPELTGTIYDSVVILDPDGQLAGTYRKSHLYPAEYRYFTAGNSLPVFTLAGVKIGVAICFEHAFPQIFTTLALRGAQVIFNPSAVPVGFSYLQDLRTRARAQDNQVFVIAVNHVGPEGNVIYCGRSLIADPRGEVVMLGPDADEGIVMGTLPFELITDQRWQEPIFRCFRPMLYEPRDGR